MALSFERTQVGLKEFGTTATVPNNSKAKLMYYLDSVATVLELHEDLPSKFLNYKTGYNRLNTEESIQLLALCQLLSPDVLTGKCIFENNEMSGPRNVRFFELSAEESTVVATESIMVAGKRVRVAKTMMYKRRWRRDYFDEPFAALTSSLRSQLAPPPREKKCIIL